MMLINNNKIIIVHLRSNKIKCINRNSRCPYKYYV